MTSVSWYGSVSQLWPVIGQCPSSLLSLVKSDDIFNRVRVKVILGYFNFICVWCVWNGYAICHELQGDKVIEDWRWVSWLTECKGLHQTSQIILNNIMSQMVSSDEWCGERYGMRSGRLTGIHHSLELL